MGGMTTIRMIILSVSFIGILASSFIVGYLLGKIKEGQKYIQKAKNMEIYFLKRGYCISCCRFDDCPKGQDNTCRGCSLYAIDSINLIGELK